MNIILEQVKGLVDKVSQSCSDDQYKMATELWNLSDALQQLCNELREKANITLQKEFDEIAVSKVDIWKTSGISINSQTTSDYFRIEGFFRLNGIDFHIWIDHEEEYEPMEYTLCHDSKYGDRDEIVNKIPLEQMPIYLGHINQFFDKFKEISKEIEMVDHDGNEPTYFYGTIDDGLSLASSSVLVFDTLSSLISNLNA